MLINLKRPVSSLELKVAKLEQFLPLKSNLIIIVFHILTRNTFVRQPLQLFRS